MSEMSRKKRNEEVYDLSKAYVANYAMQLTRIYPEINISSCNPGFIQTNMSMGYGAQKKPDEAIQVFQHLLFDDLDENGCFYACDGRKQSLVDFDENLTNINTSFEK